jgi:hypothetical protein
LAGLTGTISPAIALVPPSFYHVTVVNRDHFDLKNEVSIVASLSRGQKVSIARSLAKVAPDGLSIQIRFSGFLLTTEGRLIVRGYPADEQLFAMRRACRECVRALGCRVPITAHLKIGHLLTPLTIPQVRAFYSWFNEEAQRIMSILCFRDAYTPAGRIQA